MKKFFGMLLGTGNRRAKKGSEPVKKALEILEDIATKHDSDQKLVFEQVKKAILDDKSKYAESLKQAPNIKQWILSEVANRAGDLVETGQYHLHRGILNPMGPGPTLLKIYEYCLKELVNIEAITEENAEEEKRALMQNIRSVG